MVWLGFAVGTEASEVKGWTRPLFSLKSESPSHMLFHCEQSDLCLSFLPRKWRPQWCFHRLSGREIKRGNPRKVLGSDPGV